MIQSAFPEKSRIQYKPRGGITGYRAGVPPRGKRLAQVLLLRLGLFGLYAVSIVLSRLLVLFLELSEDGGLFPLVLRPIAVVDDPIDHAVIVLQQFLHLLQGVVLEELRHLLKSEGVHIPGLLRTVPARHDHIAHAQGMPVKLTGLSKI